MANWGCAVAHALAGAILVNAAGGVDLGSDAAIKKYYMLIWKCFYAEYLILLLL